MTKNKFAIWKTAKIDAVLNLIKTTGTVEDSTLDIILENAFILGQNNVMEEEIARLKKLVDITENKNNPDR